ncbi:TonB-dependent receptor [Christiangramia sp.]|uniref:SusC/RagA family TonB-linked outer membrane protein n=1 Tax=Christiangramia sp. TaxID=1931228 RepID=UPI00262AA194|nr:TonB-dependent receptor [Christiangramia sp.]
MLHKLKKYFPEEGNKCLLHYFFLSIMILLFTGTMYSSSKPGTSSQQNISGIVKDADGIPILGVTVLIKGTNRGTTTNFDGAFSLVASPTDTLVFSFIGFETFEELVGNRDFLEVSMVSNVEGLDQVLVVGYGTVKKSDLTGSVSSVTSKDFEEGVQTSTPQLLQGKAAGVSITQADSRPGGGFSIRIRGAGSITAGNEPLYVIDGLPGASINALNPGDIESIEILKDASATAIYGSRGANGVILVTTKKGVAGELRVNYDGYYGVQEVANRLDLLTAQEYVSFLNGIQEDQGLDPLFTPDQAALVGSGTDWQEEIFRTAPVQNHQISISGGSEKTNYYVSLNRLDQEGVVISTGFKRTSGRVNIVHSTDNFNFGLNLNTSLTESDLVPSGGINGAAGVIPAALQFDPLLSVRNAEGDYSLNQNVDLDNPVAQAETIFPVQETNQTFGSIYGEYFILDEFSAKINLGTDRSISRFDNYLTRITRRGQNTNGSANIFENEDFSNLIELTFNYNNEIGADHQINAVIGYTFQEFKGRGFNAGSQNFPTDAFLTNNLEAGAQSGYTVGSYKVENQLLSYLGRLNYTFKDKYLITGSFRADGSSRFGEDKKYGYFPSLALGWKIDKESFMEGLNDISILKLRSSYGITGNQAIGNYNSLVLLGTAGEAVFNDQQFVGIAPIQLGNPDLKWETTKQFNIGLDYGFFKSRITGSMDYFYKETSDLLLNLPIPSTSGFLNSLQNVGDTKNSGFEMSINSKNFVDDFKWSTSLNFAFLHNEVTNLGDLPFILQGDTRFLFDYTILREGEPINAYFGYKTEGVFQSQEEVDASAQPNANPGDLKFVDDNGDGVLNATDRVILGDPFADFTFGLSNNFEYKGFNLSVFLQGSMGNDLLNFTRVDSENPFSDLRNRQSYVLDRWTPDNPTDRNPSFINQDVSRAINDRVVEDASYLRLQNLSLNYTFPNLKVRAIKNLSISATGQNLFTITDYSGFNPDVNTLGTSNLRIDYNSYPLARIYTFGIKIGL